tara:strand:+ start:616 stop:1131 length:516 start_codon:yes stop_codon:yes gene_type:complete
MSKIEPTLAAPMAPSRIDFAAVLARQSERDARIAALRPANKERLFDGLTAAGITHVTVSFDGYGDSGQVESIEAYAGDAEVTFPKTQIAYAALTWDDPEVEMRALSLEDVVEQLAYDFLSDTHGGWETERSCQAVGWQTGPSGHQPRSSSCPKDQGLVPAARREVHRCDLR